jgi:hypothetical protein
MPGFAQVTPIFCQYLCFQGMALARFAEHRPQHLDMIRQQRQPPLRQIDGEEEAPTRNEVAAVCGYEAITS